MLVIEAEEMIEAVLERIACGADAAEPPFAERAGRVAGGFQRGGNGRSVAGIGSCPRPEYQLPTSVVADEGVAGMFAGHQHAPRRRADRAPGIMLRELHAFAGELVQRGRANDLLPERTEVAVAEVIGEDKTILGTLRFASHRPILSEPYPQTDGNGDKYERSYSV